MLSLRNNLGDYPGKYLIRNSRVHCLRPGIKLAGALLLTSCALITGNPLLIIALFFAELALYFIAGLGWRAFWRDTRIFFFQAPLIILLYLWKYDATYALQEGLTVAGKILLAVLPSMLVQRTTTASDMIQALRVIMPDKAAFILFTSLRFLPLLMREAQAISSAQLLRGARIAPRQLINPKNWGDLSQCFMLPLMVRILVVTREVALSAQIKGIDTHNAHIARMASSDTSLPGGCRGKEKS